MPSSLPPVPPALSEPFEPPVPPVPRTQSAASAPSGNGPPPVAGDKPKDEVQAWSDYLEVAARQLAVRNFFLRILLVCGVLLLLGLLGLIYYWRVGQYAVVRDLTIVQNPCNQGQIDISMEVVRPGKVYCRRVSGKNRTDLVDVYHESGTYTRPWSWTDQPGKPIDVSVWRRAWGVCWKTRATFPTANKIDIVILIDTTGSMDGYLKELKEKCVTFANKLREQSLVPRFALVGFGDTQDGDWLSETDFTEDIGLFQTAVTHLKRFDGGDLPESSLDALIEAMRMIEKSSQNGTVRRFFLVTDESFHPKTADGRFDVPKVSALLREKGILLDVFCRPQYEKDYAQLLGEWGNFMEIENFGRVLAEGRILEN